MKTNSNRFTIEFSTFSFSMCLLLTICFPALAMCQGIGKPVEKTASFVVDIQVAKLFSSTTMRPLIEGMGSSLIGRQFDAEHFQKIKHVRIVAGLDGVFKPFQQFMVRCTFENASGASEFAKAMFSETAEVEREGGWTILNVRGAGVPLIRYRKEIFELGSPDYCNASNESLFSNELQAALSKMDASAALRVAVESQVFANAFGQMSDELGYREEAVGQMFDQAFLFNEQSTLLYGLKSLQDLSTISFQADLESEQLAKLAIKPMSGKGEITRAKVDVLFDFFMTHCKLPLNYFKESNPPAAEVLEQVLKGIKIVEGGDSISLIVTKPKDFTGKIAMLAKSVESSFAEKRNSNLFKQVALSAHNYHDVMRKFPFAYDESQKISRDLSWRVKLLPYLENSGLYRRMQLDKSWDSMENRFAIDEADQLFVLGNSSMICGIECDPPVKSFGTIIDGSSNTIMLIENQRASMTPWTKPNDLTIDQAVKLVKAIRPGKFLWIAMYDGSVWKLPNIEKLELTDADIRNAFDPRDGNISRLVDSLESFNSRNPVPKPRRPRRFDEKIEFKKDARPRDIKRDFDRELNDKAK